MARLMAVIEIGTASAEIAIRPGHLAVPCWCEARLFHVPQSWIARGETASCGKPDCHAPDEAQAKASA